MKKIILIPTLLFCFISYSQYSNYYSVNSRLNATINQNISGTISTIDYGALAIANAQREKNGIELQRIQDDRSKMIALSIAEDPLKAYEYGQSFTVSTKDKKMFPSKEILNQFQEFSGFKNFRIDYQFPYATLFSFITPLQLQNISKDGVKSDIIIAAPTKIREKKEADIEEKMSVIDSLMGKEVEQPDDNGKMRKVFFHKISLSRATVSGSSGFRNTLIWEDKFEYCITDNYAAAFSGIGDGFTFNVKVRFHGDKNEVNFEKLEGRRFYFKQLIEKIISTIRVSELQLLN